MRSRLVGLPKMKRSNDPAEAAEPPSQGDARARRVRQGSAAIGDARRQIEHLEREFPSAADPRPPVAAPTRRKVWWRQPKIWKSALAALALLMLGWIPAQRLLATTSAEAVVNARVVTIRAPIEGTLSANARDLQIGSLLPKDARIVTIANPRVDRSHLDNLRRLTSELRTTVLALEAKRSVLSRTGQELSVQKERFRQGRIKQLEKRVAEMEADIEAASAQHAVAVEALARARALKVSGFTSQALLDKAVRDERVAREAIRGLTERRKGARVELEAAKSGTFIGDSYNDTPQSAQRALELELEVAETEARLAGARKQLADMESDMLAETHRVEERSRAVLDAKAMGRVWEAMISPGEHVNAGQELLRIVECGSPLVTASVSESTYHALSVGQQAQFRPRSGEPDVLGRVVGLTGLSAVKSSSAIQQSALRRESYHVTLEFPALAEGQSCAVGHTGIVMFETEFDGVAGFLRWLSRG